MEATIYGDTLMAGLDRAHAFDATLAERLAADREGVGSPQLSLTHTRSGIVIWSDAQAQHLSVGADGNTGYHATSGGFTIGADKSLNNIRLGAAVGSSFGSVSSSGTGGSSQLTTTSFAGYGTYTMGRGTYTMGRSFLDAQLGLNHADADVRRSLGIFGTTAKGSEAGVGFDFAASAGRTYQASGFALTPTAGVTVDRISYGALTESDGVPCPSPLPDRTPPAPGAGSARGPARAGHSAAATRCR